MASYASVVSLAQTTQKFLHRHDQQRVEGLHDRVKCLLEHLNFLQAFLEDFPNELADNLEGRIRDLANQAEDILENFIWKDIWSDLTFSQRQSAVRVRVDYRALNPLLGKITEELGSIVEEVKEIKSSSESAEDDVQPNDFAAPSSSMQLALALAPISKDSSMVGFDDDLMAIKTRLCGQSSRLQFIPIVGMGGIGKTTLARNAFNDSLIAEHFQIRAWVTVSQDYSAHQILSSLWFSINGFNKEGKEQNESIQEKVYKSLKGRRYLVVMDDMWSAKAWHDVRMLFPDDDNGSRIMITSRLYDVAAYPDSSSRLHEMCFMDAHQSWDLLKQKVFVREDCPPELESIGKTIATSCRGLPLAIVLVAGLLTSVGSRPDLWENIARNVNSAVNKTNDEQFSKILSLSYTHLPRHLRPCFLYMGGFPEDYVIHASKLIRLWVAEGFLKPNESKSLDEVAEEYLEDLVKRSLVLVTERKSNGKIKSCSVHDLVWDLCIRKAEKDKFLLKDRLVSTDFPHYLKNQYRISISYADLSFLANIYGSTTRTIICFPSVKPPFSFLGSVRLLRILDLIRWNRFDLPNFDVLPSLPVEVFELFHLRYLAFESRVTNIPSAIANLQKLQTLIIHPLSEFDLVFLPPEIWRMPQLRHIVSFPFYISPNTEVLPFAQNSLQTLSEAVDFVCTEKILKMIPNLKKLGIVLTIERKIEDYQFENLVHLHRLEKLKLKARPYLQGKLNPVLPASLKELVLYGCASQFSWKYLGKIAGSLPNLEVLKLKHGIFQEQKWETSGGQFLQLKFLSIEVSNLRQWITKSNHFPCLTRLRLAVVPNLRDIPDGVGEIPTLELIEVHFSNPFLLESAKRIQEEQLQNWGSDTLQVRFI